MTFTDPRSIPVWQRRLVLAVALIAGVAVAIAIGHTRESTPTLLIGDAVAAGNTVVSQAASEANPPPSERVTPPSKPRPGVDAEISINESGVHIRSNRGGRQTDDSNAVAGDREFDSFEQFVEQAPWLAALVFSVTALVLLVPLLIVVLIIWYKVRSNRMRNETLLKLAERGVVPPADAMAAMALGAPPPSLPPVAPLYGQPKQFRQRAAWSDLRKGIIMLAIGSGLSFWSMFDDGSANSVGLVLLCVGIGFIVIWYLEERQTSTRGTDRPGGV